MYKTTKELGYKENHRIKIIGIEGCKSSIILNERKAVKIWENYITDLCDRSNRPENEKWSVNTKYIPTSSIMIFLQSEVEIAISE
jgi:hypothetical protein